MSAHVLVRVRALREAERASNFALCLRTQAVTRQEQIRAPVLAIPRLSRMSVCELATGQLLVSFAQPPALSDIRGSAVEAPSELTCPTGTLSGVCVNQAKPILPQPVGSDPAVSINLPILFFDN
ncbi:unnamed protein product [Clonostachys chloroleuca]|uniref:Uncharacterized protein n=1 Tax=Clonostachys chloroleuca TaxID=1926264 RepID=A0AA35M4J3_9HYPO|nr:unnamed protein product [Clonostachys chloroleuca]